MLARRGPCCRAVLADRVAHHDAAPADADPEQVAVGLYHVHLPKLREAGIVECRADGRFGLR